MAVALVFISHCQTNGNCPNVTTAKTIVNCSWKWRKIATVQQKKNVAPITCPMSEQFPTPHIAKSMHTELAEWFKSPLIALESAVFSLFFHIFYCFPLETSFSLLFFHCFNWNSCAFLPFYSLMVRIDWQRREDRREQKYWPDDYNAIMVNSSIFAVNWQWHWPNSSYIVLSPFTPIQLHLFFLFMLISKLI